MSRRPPRVNPGTLFLNHQDPINAGLAAFYPMGPGGSSVLQDIGPRGVHIISPSGFGRSISPIGVATLGDGNPLSVSKSIFPTQPAEMSFVAWVKNPNVNQIFFSFGGGAVWAGTFGSAGYTFNTSNNNNKTTSQAFSSTWACFGAKFDAAGAITTYYNGALSSTGTGFALSSVTGSSILFAHSAGFGWASELVGLRFFQRGLSDGEFARLYREPWAGTSKSRISRQFYFLPSVLGSGSVALSARVSLSSRARATPAGAAAISGRAETRTKAKPGVLGAVSITGRACTHAHGRGAAAFTAPLSARASGAVKGRIVWSSLAANLTAAVQVALKGQAGAKGAAALSAQAKAAARAQAAPSAAVQLSAKVMAATGGRMSGAYAATLAASSKVMSQARGAISASAPMIALVGLCKIMVQGQANPSLSASLAALSGLGKVAVQGRAGMAANAALSAAASIQVRLRPVVAVAAGLSANMKVATRGVAAPAARVYLVAQAGIASKVTGAANFGTVLSGRVATAAKAVAAVPALRASLSARLLSAVRGILRLGQPPAIFDPDGVIEGRGRQTAIVGTDRDTAIVGKNRTTVIEGK